MQLKISQLLDYSRCFFTFDQSDQFMQSAYQQAAKQAFALHFCPGNCFNGIFVLKIIIYKRKRGRKW